MPFLSMLSQGHLIQTERELSRKMKLRQWKQRWTSYPKSTSTLRKAIQGARQAVQAYARPLALATVTDVQAPARATVTAAATDARAAEADALTAVTALVTRAVRAIAHATAV